MKKSAVTLYQQVIISTAAENMGDTPTGRPVLANADAANGIIADLNLAVWSPTHGYNPQPCLVSHHMSSPEMSPRPDVRLLDTPQVMTTQMLSRLPVPEDGRPQGTVSFSDVAAAHDQPMREPLIGMGAVLRRVSAGFHLCNSTRKECHDDHQVSPQK